MTQTEVSLTSFECSGEAQEVLEPHLLPLDNKIVGGIALIHCVDEEALVEVKLKLEAAFTQMRADESHESGACIAYAYGIGLNDEERVDEVLLETATEQNHGMLTRHEVSDSHSVWEGYDETGVFTLNKNHVPIVLQDGRRPQGVVYSLLSQKFPQITPS